MSRLHYATVNSPLGLLLVARSAKGVCRLLVGKSPAALVKQLQEFYPTAELEEAPARLRDATTWLTQYFSGAKQEVKFPLDLSGTEFQRKVWNALAAIPYGQTLSYSDVARKIGKKDAIRAVGTACGANPVALIIPCHRVLAKDGTLGGFGWGLPAKRSLLELERGKAKKVA